MLARNQDLFWVTGGGGGLNYNSPFAIVVDFIQKNVFTSCTNWCR